MYINVNVVELNLLFFNRQIIIVYLENEIMDKKDIFYFAELYGFPCFFQPEENEIVPKNAFCEAMIDIGNFMMKPIISFLGWDLPIKIYDRTITREELRVWGLIE